MFQKLRQSDTCNQVKSCIKHAKPKQSLRKATVALSVTWKQRLLENTSAYISNDFLFLFWRWLERYLEVILVFYYCNEFPLIAATCLMLIRFNLCCCCFVFCFVLFCFCSCWLNISTGLIWAFAGPALLIILVSIMVIIVMNWCESFRKSRNLTNQKRIFFLNYR